MSNVVRRFEFERRFDLEGLAAAQQAELLEREQAGRDEQERLNAEHEALKSIARSEGFEAGIACARKERESEALRLGSKFMETLELSLANAADFHREVTLDAIELALSIAEGLAGELIKAAPLASAETTIKKALAEEFERPRLLVKVAAEDLEALRDFIKSKAELIAYEGRIVVQSDPLLAVGDCIVEWSDGGIRSIMTERRDRVIGQLQDLLSVRSERRKS